MEKKIVAASVFARIKRIRENRKKGVSMGIVVCIAALLIAFSLVMVHTAGMMMATANQRIRRERCYQLAKTFAESLEPQLLSDNTGFQEFALEFMDAVYPEYDPDNPEDTMFTFQMNGDEDEGYGRISITLYKELTDDPEELDAYRDLPVASEGESYGPLIEGLRQREHYRYTISVIVTAVLQDTEYSYRTEYDYVEKRKPRFTHDGKVVGWNGTNWTDGEGEYAQPYQGEITSANPVRYIFRTDAEGILERYFKAIPYDWNKTGGGG